MNINQFKNFACIAKNKSISKAAAELFITQQALSKSMRVLQDELGTELFFRTSRGVQLTDFGEEVLAVSKTMVRSYDSCMKMIGDIARQNKNVVTISYEHAFLPFAIPAEFITSMGDMNIKFKVAGDVNTVIDNVNNKNADVGFCSKAGDAGGLEYIPVFDDPIYFIMSKSHHLAKKTELNLADLRDVAQIRPAVNSVTITSFINECIGEGFYPNFVFESTDLSFMVRTLLTNNVVQLTARFVIPAIMSEDLVCVPLRHRSLRLQVGFLVKNNDRLPRVQSLINAVLSYHGIDQKNDFPSEGHLR